MSRAIPRNVIEVDRFLVILVAVTTELQGRKRSLFSGHIRHQMIQCSIKRPGRPLNRVRRSTAQVTRCTLRVHISPLLKGTIHPGNQIDLILHSCERRHRRRERCELIHAEIRVLLIQ